MVFPLFILASSVCKSLQHLICTLTQGGEGNPLFRLTCSVVLWGRRDIAKKYCWHVWGVLTMEGQHWVCHSPRVHTAQVPGSSAMALSQVDLAFHVLLRSKLLRFLGAPQGQGPDGLCVLCSSQILAAQVTRCLVSALFLVVHVSYSPPWSRPLSFLGAAQEHSPRCAVFTLES